MRVIAGKARRLQLKTVKGMQTRPTTDRIKETLFNILQDEIPGCRFLDLFAGSGGIGIEALSRGAQAAVFVDESEAAVSCIRDNLKTTKLENEAVVLRMDACRAIDQLARQNVPPFDLVFMDPPYGKGLENRALAYLPKTSLINEKTLIIIEASSDTAFDWLSQTGYELVREKDYKTNKHLFIRLSSREGITI